MSDFTEKCEKKEKRSGIKTLYLKKKQRTEQYSISNRTNVEEKFEITKSCSLLKKKPQHSIKSSKLQTSKAEFLRSHVSNYM